MNRIPGLSALKTLEAAGRLLSFTKAAGELGVTPAAVSHQIREFEDQLGMRLFQRTSRSMRHTPAGQMLHETVAEALNSISRTVARLQRAGSKKRLKVTAYPSITAKWLVPRLDRFLEMVPDADVRFDVSLAPLDFARDDIDIAIGFGDGIYPGMKVDRLFDETIFPVCSPSLLSGNRPLRQPHDLLQHTLIHVDWEDHWLWPNWRMWMLAAGVRDFNEHRGLHFSMTSLAIQAAIDGHGVARRLRAQLWSRETLIVAITGRGQEADRQRSEEVGIDRHLLKPVELTVLRALLTDASTRTERVVPA